MSQRFNTMKYFRHFSHMRRSAQIRNNMFLTLCAIRQRHSRKRGFFGFNKRADQLNMFLDVVFSSNFSVFMLNLTLIFNKNHYENDLVRRFLACSYVFNDLLCIFFALQ